MHLVSKGWIIFRVSKQGPCFKAVEEDGGDKRLWKYLVTWKGTPFELTREDD